jgi:hypothetical protein
MKKIASLILLVTLFYNVLGYHMMFADQEKQTWVFTIEKTENSKFEVFQFNINPYGYIVDSGFEFVNEDLVIKNNEYHVFKKRIQDNVLKLYCIRNAKKTSISNDLRNIINNQLFDNTSTSKEKPNKKLLKFFIKDYIKNDNVVFEFKSILIIPYMVSCYDPKKSPLSGYFSSNFPPPDLV